MNLIERIKDECNRSTSCVECKLFDHETSKCMFLLVPCCWDIEKIYNAFEEEQKENVIPEKWTEIELTFMGPTLPFDIMRKQNEIIDFLEQIVRR